MYFLLIIIISFALLYPINRLQGYLNQILFEFCKCRWTLQLIRILHLNYQLLMINHFNFDMILEKLRIQIPSNIKSGIISKAMLAEVSDSTLKMAVNQLKLQYKHGKALEDINTEVKLDHVLSTLEKIAQRKYHFDKANIEQAEKINNFYYEANIEVGSTEKRFTCSNCKIRQFSSNSALHSHMRSCRKPFMDIENIQIVRDGEQILKREKPQKKREEKIAIQGNQFMDQQFSQQSSDSIFEQEEDGEK